MYKDIILVLKRKSIGFPIPLTKIRMLLLGCQEYNSTFIDIRILQLFNVYLIPAGSKDIIHITATTRSAGRSNIFDHRSAGMHEKCIGFLIPLTKFRICLGLGLKCC